MEAVSGWSAAGPRAPPAATLGARALTVDTVHVYTCAVRGHVPRDQTPREPQEPPGAVTQYLARHHHHHQPATASHK